MIGTSIFLAAVFVALTAWLAHSEIATRRAAQRELDIATRGQSCRGRILAVQRPFLLDPATRLYFEFAPPGSELPVHCCHTQRRSTNGCDDLLPAVGTFVTVRYLPENPREALIGR